MSLVRETLTTGGPVVAGLVVTALMLIAIVKYAVLPLLREAKPISDNLKATSDSNALAANANVQASANFKEAAEMSRRAADSWKDCISATNKT